MTRTGKYLSNNISIEKDIVKFDSFLKFFLSVPQNLFLASSKPIDKHSKVCAASHVLSNARLFASLYLTRLLPGYDGYYLYSVVLCQFFNALIYETPYYC